MNEELRSETQAHFEAITTDKIDWIFWGSHAFLDNFYLHPVKYQGNWYPTSEHAFQAQKAIQDKAWWERIAKADNPGQSKAYGQECPLRPDWEEVKDQIMFDIVWSRFHRCEYLMDRLMMTDGTYIEEGNTWGDKYWGTVNGEGKNMLGLILMVIRECVNLNEFRGCTIVPIEDAFEIAAFNQ